MVVWRLDRWGQSLPDLVVTLRELTDLGVGFVSLTEALDLTTPTGRALAGMVVVFAEFEREVLRGRVRPGIAQRPAFDRMQRAICDGEIDTVVVWKLDRISRRQHEDISLLADWCERGIRVVVVTQQID